jgi:hypothetical protein
MSWIRLFVKKVSFAGLIESFDAEPDNKIKKAWADDAEPSF